MWARATYNMNLQRVIEWEITAFGYYTSKPSATLDNSFYNLNILNML